MEQRLIWRRPQLRTDENENKERKATWLELFFDLVFVAVVAQLAHSLAGNVTWLGVLKYVLLFVPVWWAWIGSTFYNDRFETEDVSHRLWTFLQMIAVASLALHVHHGLGESSQGFALSYIAVRIIIIILWVRGGVHSPVARPLTNRYAIGFSISVILWTVSVFVDPPLRFVLWAIGLLIDIFTPLVTLKVQKSLPRLSTSHLPERFGLFTIIVLGESIVGVVAGASASHHITFETGLAGVFGLALSFSMWWLYFDRIASRKVKPNPWWLATWVYNHLVLVFGLTAIGAGTLNVISFDGAGMSEPFVWLICGAVAVSLFSLAYFEFSLAGEVEKPRVAKNVALTRVVFGIVTIILGFVGTGLGKVPLMGILAAITIIQILMMLFSKEVAAPGPQLGEEL